jgi:hypothetical protein
LTNLRRYVSWMAQRGRALATGGDRHTDIGANLLANREVAESILGG